MFRRTTSGSLLTRFFCVVLLLLRRQPKDQCSILELEITGTRILVRTSVLRHTFGGRPRFLGIVGVVGLAAVDEDAPDFLFLLPLGRPRPRLAGVIGDPGFKVRIQGSRFVGTDDDYRTESRKTRKL